GVSNWNDCRASCAQIEKQCFNRFGAGAEDVFAGTFGGGSIAGGYSLAVQCRFTSDEVQPKSPAGREDVADAFVGTGLDPVAVGILGDGGLSFAAVVGCDEDLRVVPVFGSRRPFCVARRETPFARLDPDQENKGQICYRRDEPRVGGA